MTSFPSMKAVSLIALSAALLAAGCHKNQEQSAAAGNQASTQEPASDPASANLAPVSASEAAPAAETAGAPAPEPAPAESAAEANAGPTVDEADYNEQPVATAPEPPPDLPDYAQPEDPGDGYMWTPGYWAWAPAGYYWVPGAWVQPPYAGALWTPGYWGYRNNRYVFYRGYWGPHIGFYGGVNYGFGYVGFGYQGGYWRDGVFNYNRAVNNININIVHHVYEYRVANVLPGRVSFNGGRGGIQARPRAAELAAWREPHAAPMRAQMEKEQNARQDRAQFASVNHGHPAEVAVARPLAADRGVHAPAMVQREQAAPQYHTMPGRETAPPQRQEAAPQYHAQPQRQEAAPQRRETAPQNRPQPQRQEAAPQRRVAAPQRQQAAPERRASPAAQHPAQHPAEHPAKRPEEQHPPHR